MAKVIKLTDNSAVTLLPITDSAYVQHKWKEGETGGTTITSVRVALNNVIDRVDGVHSAGSDNQHLSGTGTALASATNSSVAYINLDGNGGKVGIQGTAGTSATNQVGQADVTVSYDTASGQPNNIRIKVSYRDTNIDHYIRITKPFEIELIERLSKHKGLKLFSVADLGNETGYYTGSYEGDYYVPIAYYGLGVVKSSKTGTTRGRDYNVEVSYDGTMKVNVPWTDTVPDYSSAYAYVGQEIGKLDVNAVGSTTKEGHEKYISYIWEKDGKIEAFAQEMTAANVAYSGTGRTTVAEELAHINTTIAQNLTATTLKLVHTVGADENVVAESVTADGTEYRLKQGDNVVAKFNIEKDSFVKSGSVVWRGYDADGNMRESAGPTSGIYYGQYYIKLVINAHDADTGSAAENTLYIPAESLVDAYSASNSHYDSDGNIYSNNVTITVDQNNNTISAVIKAGGVGTNELAANAVTTAKIADGNVTKAKLESSVQASLRKADSAVQQIATGKTAGTISVDGKDVKVKDNNIATMTAATASAAGAKGLVPEPPVGSQNKVLTGAAKFKTISASQGAHATGLLYKTMDTTEEFTLFDDKSFTGSPVSLATIASPAISVSLS